VITFASPRATREHRERRDERGQAGVGGHRAVDEAGDGARGKRADDRDRHRQPAVMRQPAEHHHGEGEHRADRQVDAADHDHGGHPEREHAQHRHLVDHVEQVVLGQEERRVDRERDGEDEQAERRPARAGQQLLLPARLLGLGGCDGRGHRTRSMQARGSTR